MDYNTSCTYTGRLVGPGGNAKLDVSDPQLEYDAQCEREGGRERKIKKRNEELRVRASLTKQGQDWDENIERFRPDGEGALGAGISFSALAENP
jgi:hypothetical protein